VSPIIRRRRNSQFQRAADGSMTLLEHLQELRSRLFKASLGVVAGLVVGLFFANRTLKFLVLPYCEFKHQPLLLCQFNSVSPVNPFVLQLKVGLYIGLVIAAPIWLYQLWAFIAPGLHKRERRWTYAFTAVGGPLFFAGAALAFMVVSKSLKFFLGVGQFNVTLDLQGYFDFTLGIMLMFGIAFEFPLVVAMLNVVNIVSAKKLLSWWRIAVFLMFVFAAIVTPTPDPFGMSILAVSMALLYFGAVGFAFFNDRRRARRDASLGYGALNDDETSPLEYDPDPVEAGPPVEPPGAVERPTPVDKPKPIERRYDDTT